MFHWICPECGREIAPTVRECPACDPAAATVENALAGEVEAPARALDPAPLSIAAKTLPTEPSSTPGADAVRLPPHAGSDVSLSLIHISEPTRQAEISYAVFCLKKKKKKK